MYLTLKETIPEQNAMTAFEQEILFHPDEKEVENQVINLYPERKYETFEGFGGAITDAAGYVYSLLDEKQKKQVIDTYFKAENMNYRIVRIHMDSCDFSVGQYEAVSDPEDESLETFDFSRTEKYILPMLQDAFEATGGKLQLMLSPWSPPAFMKTNHSRVRGGSIKKEYRRRWAQIICRYIQEFQKRGFPVQRISLQNEPKAVQTWDSCILTAEDEKEFLRDYMHPALVENGLEHIEVFIWDHNKERIYERVRDTVDSDVAPLVTGAAFHWYSGEHFEALDLVREMYPDLKLIMSESCLEYCKFQEENIEETFGLLVHEIIGDLQHGMCAFYDWNLLLDETGGPNHVGNYCHAPFLFDRQKHQLMPQGTQRYFYHFSHYLSEGAQRIATTKYTDDLDCVAYENPNGEWILIMYNKRKDQALPIHIRMEGKIAEVMLQPRAVATCVIKR